MDPLGFTGRTTRPELCPRRPQSYLRRGAATQMLEQHFPGPADLKELLVGIWIRRLVGVQGLAALPVLPVYLRRGLRQLPGGEAQQPGGVLRGKVHLPALRIEICEALDVVFGVILDPLHGAILCISLAESAAYAVLVILHLRLNIAALVILPPVA